MSEKATTPRGPAQTGVTIKRASRSCAVCAVGFVDGQDHYSVLRHEAETDEWVRLDYCLACWDDVLESLDQHSVHSLWRTRFTDRHTVKQAPVSEYTPLLEICYDCLDSEKEEDQGLAYLSAMVLRRQKVFRLVRTEAHPELPQESLLFFDKVNQSEVRVPDPPLSPEALHATRRVLQARLSPIPPDEPDAPNSEEVVHEPDRSTE